MFFTSLPIYNLEDVPPASAATGEGEAVFSGDGDWGALKHCHCSSLDGRYWHLWMGEVVGEVDDV